MSKDEPKIDATCSTCHKTKTITKRAYKLNIKANLVYICMPCKLKSIGPKISEKSKTVHLRPEIKAKVRAATKRRWDEGKMDNSAAIASNHDPKKKAKIGKTVKKLWDNGVYDNRKLNLNIEATTRGLKHYYANPKNRELASIKTKAAWQDSQKILNYMNGLLKRNTPEYRAKMSAIGIKNRNRCRINLMDSLVNQKDTLNESILYKTINDLGYSAGKTIINRHNDNHQAWTYDCLVNIGPRKILFEIQWDWAHQMNQNRCQLKINLVELLKDQGYELHFLNEIDFYSPGKLKQIVQDIIGIKFQLQDFNFNQVTIRQCSTAEKSDCNKLLYQYHYLNPSKKGIYYGAFIGDELIAVATFAPPTRLETAKSLGLEQNEIIELSRFCIKPTRQKKNFGSWMLSRCMRMLTNNISLKAFVSFADTTVGHTGTIYKALGFIQDHFHTTYRYRDADGHTYHKKSVYNRASNISLTELEYAVQFGLIKIKSKKILRFVKHLID